MFLLPKKVAWTWIICIIEHNLWAKSGSDKYSHFATKVHFHEHLTIQMVLEQSTPLQPKMKIYFFWGLNPLNAEGHIRHWICHGRTDIVRLKFDLPGVNFCSEHTLFVVNSLLVVIFSTFLVQFVCPIN